jgi:hypothetical protein
MIDIRLAINQSINPRMGLREIPQEPCVMIKNGVIVFYVDDIVFAYRKEHEKEAIWAKELGKTFQLKWFIGIHIIGDRTKRLISLSPAAHIDKVAN